ncbi:MAG: protein kinase [Gemmatimonadota bacterium]|nr:MAG: protein kinase [Gemmatimonadota bacterium]
MVSTQGFTKALTSRFAIGRSLLRNIVLLILVAGGAVLAVVLFEAYRAVETLSASLIDRAADQTEAELQRFFEPVGQNISVAAEWGATGTLDPNDIDQLNSIFIPQLKHSPQMSSMMVANTRGFEHMLLQSDGEWLNRRMDVDVRGNQAHWMRWRAPDDLIVEWWDELEYDPRVRPWFQLAMEGSAGEIRWTEPYTFFTTKDPGITVSTRWYPTADSARPHVVAFDITLTDISRFTTGVAVEERGSIVVLTEDRRVLGLPRDDRYSDLASLRAAVLRPADSLGIAALSGALNEWGSTNDVEVSTVKYSSGGEVWWAGFRPFELSPDRRLWIGAVIPQDDILGSTIRQRNTIVGITLATLILGILIAVLLDRAYQKRLSSEVLKAKQLGQYTLVEKIGEGGMGSVYRARHSMLRRPTAIKLIKAEQGDQSQALSRFEQEVQLTSQLTHSNTIAIYDYGRTPDDVFYYAMEYLDGVSLQDMVDRTGPMPADRTIHVLQQVCGSLAEAHGIGLIHRDIKPHNIMLCERGGSPDVVKVLDFGLVKHVDTEANVELTAHDGMVGTPGYMAPEGVHDPQGLDGRSDLYLVGAVGYYMLTGTRVFSGLNALEVLAQHVTKQPEPPSDRTPGIPSDLERVILTCLAKDPAERPADALHLRMLLGECVDAGKWTEERARAWWSEHGELARTKVSEMDRSRATDSVLTIDLAARV